MDDKITIIEGPTPTFEDVDQVWAIGLNESCNLYDISITRLRTFNGSALVERCHRTWRDQSTMYLHFRNRLGMEERTPILAARSVETNDGQVLLLWCRREVEESEEENDASDHNEEE